MNDKKLWDAFSQYIRLKYSDKNGFCSCYTCGRVRHWTKLDCGHGIPRQHKPTKFEEKNNRPQCKPCNGFEGGRREVFKRKMDREHGPGTWDRLEIISRQKFTWTQFEIDALEKYYWNEVMKLKVSKQTAPK